MLEGRWLQLVHLCSELREGAGLNSSIVLEQSDVVPEESILLFEITDYIRKNATVIF